MGLGLVVCKVSYLLAPGPGVVMKRLPRLLVMVFALVVGTGVPVGGVGVAAEPAVAGAGELVQGWKIQSSAVVRDAGAVISRADYRTDGWLPISRPETLMAGLLENGRFPDVFRSDNLASVPT